MDARDLDKSSSDAAKSAAQPPTGDLDKPVYAISVAAELVGLGVGTLRQYEARGLLCPQRTQGGTRRYSPNDLLRLQRISFLLAEGLNLAGIALVLQLQDDILILRQRLGEDD